MGCKSGTKDSNMPRRNSQERDTITGNGNNTNTDTSQRTNLANLSINSSTQGRNDCPISPTTTEDNPASTPHLSHSSTDPNIRNNRPHSAHHHRIMGRLLRAMGDGYCYSCGIALRQMGDQLAGEYEVRRALSTGDLPNSVKNT